MKDTALSFIIRALRKIARELERFTPAASGLRIEYRLAEDDSEIQNKDNLRGTHLNETGSGKSASEYLAAFSIEAELDSIVVRGNLEFIERQIVPLAGPGASIVDVGCGSGKYGRLFKRPGAPTAGWKYSGVERSDEIVALASKTFPDLEFRCSNNSGRLPLPDRSQDVVMASAVLQYMTGDWKTALDEMKRVSRRYVFLSRVPVTKHHRSGLCHQTVSENGRTEHNYFTVFNRDELEQTLAEKGLVIIKRDHVAETFPVHGLPELVLSYQYLLEIK